MEHYQRGSRCSHEFDSDLALDLESQQMLSSMKVDNDEFNRTCSQNKRRHNVPGMNYDGENGNLDMSFDALDLSKEIWKTEAGPTARSYGVSMGSPGSYQRRINTKPPMWKTGSFGSDTMSYGSSSQSSGSSVRPPQKPPSGLPAAPMVLTGSHQRDQPIVLTGSHQRDPFPNFDMEDEEEHDSGSQHESIPEKPPSRMSLSDDTRWAGRDKCVERQAQAYRSAAASSTAAAVWSGILPPRNTRQGAAFSCKVFLGGVPWDISETDLQTAFGTFGSPKIEWPSAHDQSSRNVKGKGHLYLIFDTEKSVKQLLGCCNYDFNQGHHNWYYKVASKRMRIKEVQVIPWQLADASYVRNGCMTTFGTKTVFVGSLHGMLTAEGLAKVLDDLFGGVVAATVDTDKYKYPIGSGRVTFKSNESYMAALRAVFVDLRTPKFNKKIQIDPFLEDSACSICSTQVGPYFCRDLQCFSYFCHDCWQWQHSARNIGHHIPLMRNPRPN